MPNFADLIHEGGGVFVINKTPICRRIVENNTSFGETRERREEGDRPTGSSGTLKIFRTLNLLPTLEYYAFASDKTRRFSRLS